MKSLQFWKKTNVGDDWTSLSHILRLTSVLLVILFFHVSLEIYTSGNVAIALQDKESSL